MHKTARVTLLVVAAIWVAMPAWAQQKGFGLGAGASSTKYSEPGLDIDFGGTAFAFDFQVPLKPGVSLNPFVMIVKEDGQDVTITDPFFGTLTFSTALDYQIIGLQFRFWAGDAFFVGAQMAQHSVTLTVSEPTLGSGSDTETKFAVGFAAGAQLTPNIGLYAQYDSLSIQGSDITSLRVLLSYRITEN